MLRQVQSIRTEEAVTQAACDEFAGGFYSGYLSSLFNIPENDDSFHTIIYRVM